MYYLKQSIILCSIMFMMISPSSANTSADRVVDQTNLQTIDGQTIQVSLLNDGMHFKGFENKIVLLEFFGHSCPPCQASIPGYNRLQKKYANDVAVITVESWGMNIPKLKDYVKQHTIHYKVVPTSNTKKIFSFVKKLTGWSTNYGVPFLMLFAPDGKLAKTIPPGRLNEPYVEKLIEEIRGK